MPTNLPALLPPHWKDEVVRWISQDMPKWDVGGFVVGDAPHHAMLLHFASDAPADAAGGPEGALLRELWEGDAAVALSRCKISAKSHGGRAILRRPHDT